MNSKYKHKALKRWAPFLCIVLYTCSQESCQFKFPRSKIL